MNLAPNLEPDDVVTPEEKAERNEKLLREAAKLLGMMFIGRREAKAVFTNGQWLAVREKFTIGDFRRHLIGKQCLGAYMLDADSMVRSIAFDIDLQKNADFFLIADNSTRDPGDPAIGADGELDLQVEHNGNLAAALHRPDDPAHRWASNLVGSTAGYIRKEVYDALGLTSTTIVTGKGAHVWVPLGELMPAADARAMAHEVMDGVPIFTRRSESFYTNHEKNPSLEVEVYPKQDTLTDPDSLGNLLRLPFGWHEAGIRTYALSAELIRTPSWSLPKMSSMDALRLQAAMLNLEWTVVE